MVLVRQKHEAPLSMKSPESRTKGDVDVRGGNYGKGLNKQDVNLTDRLLADGSPERKVRRNGAGVNYRCSPYSLEYGRS